MNLHLTNWRTFPASTVLAIIETEQRRTGSRLAALQNLLYRHGYRIAILDGVESCVNHTDKIVTLPPTTPAEYERMLLHETTEILLRLPVAPEYRFVPTGRDEYHEVACLVERALL